MTDLDPRAEAAEWSEPGQGYRCPECGAHRVTRDLLDQHLDRHGDDDRDVSGQATLGAFGDD